MKETTSLFAFITLLCGSSLWAARSPDVSSRSPSGILATTEITKTADPASGSVVAPGGRINYYLNVRNTGSAPSGSIIIVDTVDTAWLEVGNIGEPPIFVDHSYDPPVITWWLVDTALSPGDEIELSYGVTVKTDAPPGDTVRNRAYSIDTLTQETSFSDVEHYIGALTIEKRAGPPSGQTVNFGDTILYTVRYENLSGEAISEIRIYDVIDTLGLNVVDTLGSYVLSADTLIWRFTNVTPGVHFANLCRSVVRDIPVGLLPYTIWNQYVCKMSFDTVASNTIYHEVSMPGVDSLLKRIVKRDSVFHAGDTVTYTLMTRNTGTYPAHNVTIIDSLPTPSIFVDWFQETVGVDSMWIDSIELGWKQDLLPVGDSMFVQWSAVILDSPPAVVESVFTNIGMLTCDEMDSVILSEAVIDSVIGPAIVITKVDSPVSGRIMPPGDTIYYAITVENIGNRTTYDDTLIDILSIYVDSVSHVSGPDSFYNDSVITWHFDSLPPGFLTEVSYTAYITPDTTQCGCVLANSAYMAYGDTSLGDDDTAFSAEVSHVIGLVSIQKTAVPPAGMIVNFYEQIDYTLIYHNWSKDSALVVAITDTIDTFAVTVIDSGSGVYSQGVLTWADTLAIDEGNSVSFSVVVNNTGKDSLYQPNGRTLLNRFAIAGRYDTVNTVIQHTVGMPEIDFLAKTAQPPSGTAVTIYDTLTYYLTATNVGSDSADRVTIVDTIEAPVLGSLVAINAGNADTAWLNGDVITWERANLPFEGGVNSLAVGWTFWITDTSALNDTIWNSAFAFYAPVPGPETLLMDTSFSDTIYSDTVRHSIERARFEFRKVLLDSMGIDTIPDGESIYAGDKAWYHLIIENVATVRAESVVVVDSLWRIRECAWFDSTVPPAGTIRAPDSTVAILRINEIGPGDTAVVKLRLRTKVPPAKALEDIYDTLFNTAYIRSINSVPDTTNTTWHYVVGGADFERPSAFTKWSEPPTGTDVSSGDTIRYFVRYENMGNAAAWDVVVEDTVSSLLTIVDPGAGSVSGQVITWGPIDTVLSGQIDSVSFTTVVRNTEKKNAAVSVGRGFSFDPIFERQIYARTSDKDTLAVILNSAFIYGSNIDSAYTQDTTRHLLQTTGVFLSKNAMSDTASSDDTVFYHIAYGNTGQGNLYEVAIRDTILEGREFIDTMFNYNGGLWTFDTIMPGVLDTITYAAVIKSITAKTAMDTLFGKIVNRVTMESGSFDTAYSDYDTVQVWANVGVEISDTTDFSPVISVLYDTVATYREHTYTLYVANSGWFEDDIVVDTIYSKRGWQVSAVPTRFDTVKPGLIDIRSMTVNLASGDRAETDTCIVRVVSSTEPADVDSALLVITAMPRQIVVEPDTQAVLSKPGDRITYNIRIMNMGVETDSGDVTIQRSDTGWESWLLVGGDSIFCGDTTLLGPIAPFGMDTIFATLHVTSPSDLMREVNKASNDSVAIIGMSHIDHNAQDSALVVTAVIPLEFTKRSVHNYPNPFRKDLGTTFVFALPEAATVSIRVYSRTGDLVAVVLDEKQYSASGLYKVQWSALNLRGERLGAETYIYVVKALEETIMKKLVILPVRK